MAGKEIIKHFESLHDGDLKMIGLQPKMCPAGIWTEGYGHAMIYQGQALRGIENKELAYKLHTVNTIEEAERLLAIDLISREKVVEQAALLVKGGLNENQFSALVSFVYNLGSGQFRSSTLYKYLMEGRMNDAANEFEKWNKSGGKVLDGLTYRRKSEKELFLNGVLILYGKAA
jgi:lysozyme